jgi:cell division protein FtsL
MGELPPFFVADIPRGRADQPRHGVLLLVLRHVDGNHVLFAAVKQFGQRQGGFVPGVRPGKPTDEYLSKVINRITWGGALFLAIVAVLPFLIREVTNVAVLTLSSTGILIMVGVALDTMKQIEAQLVKLSQGESVYPIAGHQGLNLKDNPYWPAELANAGHLAHERHVALLPLALSRGEGSETWQPLGDYA